MSTTTKASGLLMMCGLLCVVVQARAADKQKGASPQDVFSAAKRDLERKDYRSFTNRLTADAKDQCAVSMLGLAMMAKQFKKTGSEQIDAVVTKHFGKGGPPQIQLQSGDGKEDLQKQYDRQVALILAPVRDRAALISDLLKVLSTIPEVDPSQAIINGSLKDVKVQDASASGNLELTKGGKVNTHIVKFKKTDDGWRIAAELFKPVLRLEGKGTDGPTGFKNAQEEAIKSAEKENK